MINPELGTAPRPDVTGPTKYDAVPTHDFSGISKADILPAIPFSTPWGAFWMRFDFPETKFAATGYEVEVSLDPKFEDRTVTGISGSPSAGDFNQICISLNRYEGGSSALQPNTQYFARVRAVTLAGPGAWSESCGISTKPLPNGGDDPNMVPSAGIVATATAASISYTITAAPNPVSASPIFDYRAVARDAKGHTLVAAEAAGTLGAHGPGEYEVMGVVTDEAGMTVRCMTKVTVPEA